MILLSLLSFLCLFRTVTEIVMVLTNHKNVQTTSPAGKQHNGGVYITKGSYLHN